MAADSQTPIPPPSTATIAPNLMPVTTSTQQPTPQRQTIPIMTRDSYNSQSLGRGLNAHVKQARVLMVGAGGIGCELLKNLALTGFGEIHAVDLDTIDLSNLNRQFLFRHEHIKKSKALVAKEAAQRFNPTVKIVAHHANIKEPQFNVEWFRGFRLVFNALDNLDARRHVNRMCLAADVPLIESGTTGFKGQVQVIKKGRTACYDCAPKETPKSFPVCTIRSTPSQPIHCIVWGKSYLLNEIFGASEDESAFDHSDDQEDANEVEELKREAAALRSIRQSIGTDQFPELLFDKVFKTDIERLRSMEDMWKDRKPPNPLGFKSMMAKAADELSRTAAIVSDGQKVWSLEECFVVYVDSLSRLSKRMVEMRKGQEASSPGPTIEFDKDDDDTLDFVAASANIRSSLFGIEARSRFDIKQMAGNIIPAIATTNAIVAGLCVLEAFKVIKGDFDSAKEVFLTPFMPARLLAPDRPRRPNPECPVCSVYQTSVRVDLSRATLQDLVEDFVKLELGFGDKDFVVNNEIGTLYDVDETENLTKKLSELGIKPDSFLTIIDEDDDDPFVNVVVNIQESKSTDGKPVYGVQLDKKPEIPKKPKQTQPEPEIHPQPQARSASNGDSATANGRGPLALPDRSAVTPQKAKRHLDGDADAPDAKKAKTTVRNSDDDVVIVDDTSNGAIVIDD